MKFNNKFRQKLLKLFYSEDYYIKNKPGTQNVAYLSSALQLHTDLPYYDYTPGVRIFFTLNKQSVFI